MCGIAGYAGNGSAPQLRRMTEAIQRRGPDDDGFYEAPGVGFGFRRLSIIDLSTGHQPLSNADGSVWVMLNGEIYGYQTQRMELERLGYRFTTQSDTEVIVHAYEAWGDACFEKLQGMFAIAIWDARTSRLLLARDRMGKKPLYWTVANGTLWFASEVKALLAAGIVDRKIDVVLMGAYFRSDCVPTPRSIFQGVSKGEPATAMSWREGRIEKMWMFWKPPTPSANEGKRTSDQIIGGLRECLDIAVRERLVSDVPVGLFLSGGLDSAVVAESAARQAGRVLPSFTIGFEDVTHDEREVARDVAKRLGLDHHETVLSERDALQMMDEAVELLDEPLADAAILPQLLLARFTRQEVTVALSGDGGDELLLGYQHLPAHRIVERFPHVPNVIGRGLLGLSESIPTRDGYFSFGFKLQRLLRGISAKDMWSRDVAWRGACDAPTLMRLLRPEILADVHVETAEDVLRSRAGEMPSEDVWRRWAWVYLRTFLMDDVLVKVDRATMWFSLEGRAPLLDTRVVSYLLSVPTKYKVGEWKSKRIFQELLRDRIPASILNRPKHGFGVPTARWLRGPLRERLLELTSTEFLVTQGLFQPEEVQRLVQEHHSGRVDRRKELWALLMFQQWYVRWCRP